MSKEDLEVIAKARQEALENGGAITPATLKRLRKIIRRLKSNPKTAAEVSAVLRWLSGQK